MNETQSLQMPAWYSKLSENCFPTVFVELNAAELDALKNGVAEGEVVRNILPRLSAAMKKFSGSRFISVDTAAPTDTERFELKRGKIVSAVSAWKVLCSSEKVKKAVEEGLVTSICVRPYRHMQPAREFRLFIKNGKLVGMSQYWLIRHFRRLPDRLERYWNKAETFVQHIQNGLPRKDLAADIYFTSGGEILLIDLNPWGDPTDPLMYNEWERDWTVPAKCEIVPAPHKVSGEVEVHF